MTSPAHSDLAFTLTNHYFGGSAAKLLKILYNCDQASLKLLRSNLPDLKLENIKRSLLLLVKYQLVDYVKTINRNFNQQYEYSIVPHRVFCFFRLPTMIHCIASSHGFIAKTMLTVIAENGVYDEKKLVQSTMARAKPNWLGSDANQLKVETEVAMSRLIREEYLVQTANSICISIEKLSRRHRDAIIVEAVYTFYNKETKIRSICRAILDLSFANTPPDSAYTAPVALANLKDNLIPDTFSDLNQVESYILRLCTERAFRFFSITGDHSVKGRLFALNIGLVIDYLLKEHICSLITTRFGPKCCRVFRVLLHKGPLMLRQIEEIIMLPARDVREYSYMLIKEGFIRNRQVPKTPDNAPGKSVFIMSVEMYQVVYKVADLCCRSIDNLLMRHEHELRCNETLLERSQAAQELLGSNENAEQDVAIIRDEWSQYFNSHEMTQLEKINQTVDRILTAKFQVEETLFLAHTWLSLKPSMDADVSL